MLRKSLIPRTKILKINTTKPIHSKVEAIKNILSPKTKQDVMHFLGTINFYSKIIEKLHINS